MSAMLHECRQDTVSWQLQEHIVQGASTTSWKATTSLTQYLRVVVVVSDSQDWAEGREEGRGRGRERKRGRKREKRCLIFKRLYLSQYCTFLSILKRRLLPVGRRTSWRNYRRKF